MKMNTLHVVRVHGREVESSDGKINIQSTPGTPKTPITLTIETGDALTEALLTQKDAHRIALKLNRLCK